MLRRESFAIAFYSVDMSFVCRVSKTSTIVASLKGISEVSSVLHQAVARNLRWGPYLIRSSRKRNQRIRRLSQASSYKSNWSRIQSNVTSS